MRLVDFLIEMLLTQAESLKQLAVLFGEEVLVQILERAGEAAPVEHRPPRPEILDVWQGVVAADDPNPYGELQLEIQKLNLPPRLEFFLWTYPFYRTWVEGEIPLGSRFRTPPGDAYALLLDEAALQADLWMKDLKLPAELEAPALAQIRPLWKRFRMKLLNSPRVPSNSGPWLN